MPRGDGTGPLGQGPFIGRGRGYGNRVCATGIPFRAYSADVEPALSVKEEAALLKSEAERLRSALESIEQRLEKLETT